MPKEKVLLDFYFLFFFCVYLKWMFE